MWSDDLTRLRSLVAVIDSGSVAAAAASTGYSPAAVSRHLSSLERELGLALFERTARSLRPSVLARVIGDKAHLLLEEAESFADEVRQLAEGTAGVVRLAYFRAVGTTLLPRILAEMQAIRPDVRIVTMECTLGEEVTSLLLSGQADLGFTWGHPDVEDDGLHSFPLLSDALVLMTSAERGDLHADPADLRRLVGEPFVGPLSYRTGSPPVVDRMFLERGLPAPTVRHRVTDHAMSKAMIANGAGVALLPALGVSDTAPGLRRSIVTKDFRTVYLARSSQRTPPPPVAALEAAIRRVVRAYRGFGVQSLVDDPT